MNNLNKGFAQLYRKQVKSSLVFTMNNFTPDISRERVTQREQTPLGFKAMFLQFLNTATRVLKREQKT